MRRIPLWLPPLAALPLVALGLWLWRDQGVLIRVSDFIAGCLG